METTFLEETFCTLSGNGLTSGMVISCGEGSTSVSGFFDGMELPATFHKQFFGGRDITDLLYSHYLNSPKHSEVFRDRTTSDYFSVLYELKEKTEYIRQRGKISEEKKSESIFVLPDGRRVELGDEKFQIPELLFSSNFDSGYKDIQPIQELVKNCLSKADFQEREELCKNVVLEGGVSATLGFGDRLAYELQESVSNYSCNILQSFRKSKNLTFPKFSCWVGASISAYSVAMRKDRKITKEDYNEHGVNILVKRRVY